MANGIYNFPVLYIQRKAGWDERMQTWKMEYADTDEHEFGRQFRGTIRLKFFFFIGRLCSTSDTFS